MMASNTLVRLAGLSYLILILAGLFGMVYVPAALFDWGDPAQTWENLENRILLFRLGTTGCLVGFIAFAILSGLLYAMFAGAEKLPALLLLCFGVLGAAAFTGNTFNYVEIITLVTDTSLDSEEVGRDILYLAANFNNGFVFAQVFTGLWLVSLGFLSYTSRLLPNIICALLLLSGSVNYLGGFAVKFIFPEVEMPLYLSLPGTLGEFSACLWLLVFGAARQELKGVLQPRWGE